MATAILIGFGLVARAIDPGLWPSGGPLIYAMGLAWTVAYDIIKGK